METSILGCPQPLTGQIHNQEMSPAKNKTNQNKKKEEKEKKKKKGNKTALCSSWECSKRHCYNRIKLVTSYQISYGGKFLNPIGYNHIFEKQKEKNNNDFPFMCVFL